MIDNSRFMRLRLDQAACACCSLVNAKAITTRPADTVSAYVHRAWRADSPEEELLTG